MCKYDYLTYLATINDGNYTTTKNGVIIHGMIMEYQKRVRRVREKATKENGIGLYMSKENFDRLVNCTDWHELKNVKPGRDTFYVFTCENYIVSMGKREIVDEL